MVSSAVGYTGGDAENPTYKTVCRGDGYTEALEVDPLNDDSNAKVRAEPLLCLASALEGCCGV